MTDESHEHLITGNGEFRRRVAELEGVDRELRQAVEALRESEARYRTLAEFSPDIVYILDTNGKLLYANRTAAQYIGISPESLAGKTQFDLFPPEQARLHLQRIRKVLETGESGEMEQLYRFGSRDVWLNVRSIPIRNEQGSVISVMGVCRNITARKLAEEALIKAHAELEQKVQERTAALTKANDELRASEEKYRTLVETSPDAVIMSDLEGHITFASSRALQMYGSDNIEDLLGRNPLDFFAPEYHQKFLTSLQETLEDRVSRQVEYEFVRKDGTLFAGESSSAMIRDASGRPTGFVAIVRDVTERRKANEALLRERSTLKHLLRASDHERQLIAYDIHDGLAQELAGAMMQFQIYDQARATNADGAAGAFETAMAMLQQSHAEARRLISGVRPPILDEWGVMAAVAHLIYDPAHDQGPRIDFRNRVTFKRLAPVLENVIYRIVQEGLTNARNHSKSEKILVRLLQRGDRLHIEIRDRGVGFDPAAVPENRFGLQGIRDRARLLGGTCRVKSKPGEGTSILVELPLADEQP